MEDEIVGWIAQGNIQLHQNFLKNPGKVYDFVLLALLERRLVLLGENPGLKWESCSKGLNRKKCLIR